MSLWLSYIRFKPRTPKLGTPTWSANTLPPATCNLYAGVGVPIPTFPLPVIINGVASLASSWISKAFPVPLWLRKIPCPEPSFWIHKASPVLFAAVDKAKPTWLLFSWWIWSLAVGLKTLIPTFPVEPWRVALTEVDPTPVLSKILKSGSNKILFENYINGINEHGIYLFRNSKFDKSKEIFQYSLQLQNNYSDIFNSLKILLANILCSKEFSIFFIANFY
jgi:hypothetical protein